MKKIFLALALVISLLIAGCAASLWGGDEEKVPTESTEIPFAKGPSEAPQSKGPLKIPTN